jgi:hypothetical protein
VRADCFKNRNKVGIDVAVEALRDYSRMPRGGTDELLRFARICRVSRVMQPPGRNRMSPKEILALLMLFLLPILDDLRNGTRKIEKWLPGGPWR